MLSHRWQDQRKDKFPSTNIKNYWNSGVFHQGKVLQKGIQHSHYYQFCHLTGHWSEQWIRNILRGGLVVWRVNLPISCQNDNGSQDLHIGKIRMVQNFHKVHYNSKLQNWAKVTVHWYMFSQYKNIYCIVLHCNSTPQKDHCAMFIVWPPNSNP